MKKVFDQLAKDIDSVYEQFSASTHRAANVLRWFLAVMFLAASLWTINDDTPVIFIYPTLALLWFFAALIFGLRAKSNLMTSVELSTWIDVGIVSTGLLLCAWLGAFSTKGWIIFLCYFPILALTARRFDVLFILRIAAFILVFYGLVSLFALETFVLTRLLAFGAMVLATIALAAKPKKELVETTRQTVQTAYQLGAAEKAAELIAYVHEQAFPPKQFELPGLYTAYKHGVGTVTSGDFYAAIETARGPMVVLGDLPGSGLNAAFAATELQKQITQIAQRQGTLEEIAAEVNALLWHKRQQAGCAFARWQGSQLHYLNAGHLPAIRIAKRETEQLLANAPPLGQSETVAFPELVIDFPKGDLLLLYTDGSYAGLATNREAGAAEILRLTDQFNSGEVNTICHRVFDCGLPEYSKPEDDSTVVIARRQEFTGEVAG